ncbi:MAG: TonB-dependent receptor, partial [Pseudomonadota bacterium]
TFGAFDFAVDVNEVLNDQAAFRVNAYFERLNNHRDFFEGERFGINPTLFYEISPSTTVNLSYEYVNNERFVDRGIPSLNGEPAFDLVDITFSDPEFATTTLEAHIVRGIVEHQFSDNIKGNFSVTYNTFDKLYANIFASDDFEANTTDPNILGTVELDGYIDTTDRDSIVLSSNLIGEFQTGSILHNIVLGAEFIDTNNDNDRFNAFFSTQAAARAEELALLGASGIRTDQAIFNVFAGESSEAIDLNFGNGTVAGVTFDSGVSIPDGAPVVVSFGDFNVPNADVANSSILNDDTEAGVTVFSAFIQNEIAVTDWFDLVLGVRYDSFDITVNNIETLINTGVEDILTRRDDNFAPRVGIILKPRENISLYGSFSETFLPRSGEQFADINPPDDALDPDTSTNLEVGLKWDFFDNLSFTFAAFDIENSSPQENDDDPGTLDVIDSEVRGIEAQLQGYITDQWFFSAGYSFLEGNQVDIIVVDGVETVQDAVDADGNLLRLRELPEHTFNLWTSYDITPKFGVGFGLTFQDESFAGFSNEVTLPSFTRLDATAYYNVNENLRLQVNIENLTDTEYFPNSHTDNNITVGAPLNAKFTISGRF